MTRRPSAHSRRRPGARCSSPPRAAVTTGSRSVQLARARRRNRQYRDALRWALEAAPEIGLRLSGQLGRYWGLRDDLEGLQWLDAALLATDERAPITDRARARLHHAHQLRLRNQGAAAIDEMQTALALYRHANDHAGVSETLSMLAPTVGAFLGDLAAEHRYAQEACDHARIAGDDRLLGRALGRLAVVSGDQRRTILTQASELLILALGDYRELANACSTAAYVALAEDRVTEAISLLETALEATTSVEDPWTTQLVLSNLGLARLFSNDLDRARDGPPSKQAPRCRESKRSLTRSRTQPCNPKPKADHRPGLRRPAVHSGDRSASASR